MCIVCEIKKLNPSPEVMAKVEELARGLDTALTVAQEVAEANPGAFSDEQRDRMQSAADLLNQREGVAGLAALLGALLGGRVNVETVANTCRMAAAMPKGKAGECFFCGEHFARVVEVRDPQTGDKVDACGRCRDRRGIA